MPSKSAQAAPDPQGYPRHTLAETRQILRDYVWHRDRLGLFYRQTAAQVLMLWLIDHVHDCAPKDHTRWDELRWYPRVKVSGAIRMASVNEARTIAGLRGASYQSMRDMLRSLRDDGLITYDEGYTNIRIVGRDQDDMPRAAEPRLKSRGTRTVLMCADDVEESDPVAHLPARLASMTTQVS
ncbi:MAG TPA: hypothetical protein VHZ03_30010 [Trebonia sp.]|jgi:hypothetical protein|nr:hypothetical protein [Trebonia sp.]